MLNNSTNLPVNTSEIIYDKRMFYTSLCAIDISDVLNYILLIIRQS